MVEDLNKRWQLICLWCAVPGILCFVIGWLISGYFPPPSQAMSSVELQQHLRDNLTGTRVGGQFMAVGGVLLGAYWATIYIQMRRIEGPRAPLAYTQLLLGAVTVVTFILGALALLTAAYRPNNNPDVNQAFQDLFYIDWIASWWAYAGQTVAMGLLALRSIPNNPLPRWYGYLQIWCALGFTASVLFEFNKTGPFSLTGILGLYVVAITGIGALLSTLYVFRRAILSEEPTAKPLDLGRDHVVAAVEGAIPHSALPADR